MSARDSWKLLVFRDGKSVRSGSKLLRELCRQTEEVLSLCDFTSRSAQEELIEALLRSGELECALADQEHCETQAAALAALTDDFAAALIEKRQPNLAFSTRDALPALAVPEQLTIAPPEGFCYYALHPLDYSDLLRDSAIDAPAAAVVGIRSIGTTLSAIVCAWFNLHGIPAERITVRPTGHPFDRSLAFDGKQQRWIAARIHRAAQFFVVDEGPGLSGSSFLAVAEALERAGVAPGQITLLPSSGPDLGSLIASNAVERWSRFRTLALQPTRRLPEGAAEEISGGEWRKRVFRSASEWPAVWSWTERKKYLSTDGERIFRFDGHGHYGKAARQRSEVLAECGWGPGVSSVGDGFSESPWLNGIRPSTADREVLIQLARYCAFRAEYFSHEVASQEALEEMTRVNLDRALGVSIPISLPVERPVIADARMMPHEWIRCTDGRLLKLDASSHGDDHFYPGPTDIAWDIAGAISEWRLKGDDIDLLVSEYQRLSGDNVESRLSCYVLAYCVFRLAFATSAGHSVSDADERMRFEQEAETWRQMLADCKSVRDFRGQAGKKNAGFVAAGT